jgi:hypothetical protein
MRCILHRSGSGKATKKPLLRRENFLAPFSFFRSLQDITNFNSEFSPMKKACLLFLLVFTAGIVKAQQTPTTAFEFNEYIVDISNTLYKKGEAWGTAFQQAAENMDFSTLAPHRKGIEEYTVKSISDLEKMKDIGGSYELRTAMISFLKYEKDLIEKAFIPIEKLNSESTQEEIDAAIENLTALSEKEGDELEKITTAQKRYAKENNFTIEE